MKFDEKRLLLLFSVLAAAPFFLLTPIDPDLGWHLLGGTIILRDGSLPPYDPINTFAVTPWHDYHWLAQVIMAKAYELGGVFGLRVLFVGVFAALAFVITRIHIRSLPDGRESLYGLLVLGAGLVLLGEMIQFRPQVMSLLLIALALDRVLQAPRRRDLVILFVLAALCANIHVYWVFIPVLWVLFRGADRARKVEGVSALTLWGGAALLVCAGFVSPYGLNFSVPLSIPTVVRNYALLYDYMNIPSVLKQTVGEFHSPFVLGGSMTIVLVMSMVVALSFISLKRWRHPDAKLIIGVGSFILTLKAAKFAAIFVIMAMPLFSSLTPSRRLRHLDAAITRFLPSRAQVAVLFVAYIGYMSWTIASRPGDPSIFYPIDACKQLAHMDLKPTHGRSHVRLMTHFDFGGWCRWIIDQENPNLDYRTTTDNRTQGVPGEEYEASFDAYGIRNDWMGTLKRWKPDAIVTSKNQPLAQVLYLAQGEWKILFGNDKEERFAVFVPIENAKSVGTP